MKLPHTSSRDWLTTREVQKALGNLTQQRVSQLVRAGTLVAEPDSEGRLRYDRTTVERVATERAVARERDGQRDETRALQIAARERLTRARKREKADREQREREVRSLQVRAVEALERLARKETR